MNQLKEMLEAYRNGERGLPTYAELAAAVDSYDALVTALERCVIRIEEECADPEYLDCVISAKEILDERAK